MRRMIGRTGERRRRRCSAIKAGPTVTATMIAALAQSTAAAPPSIALSSTRITVKAATRIAKTTSAAAERRRFAAREMSHAVKKSPTASADPKMIRSGAGMPIVRMT